MFRGEVTNNNLIVLGLTRPGLQPFIVNFDDNQSFHSDLQIAKPKTKALHGLTFSHLQERFLNLFQ